MIVNLLQQLEETLPAKKVNKGRQCTEASAVNRISPEAGIQRKSCPLLTSLL